MSLEFDQKLKESTNLKNNNFSHKNPKSKNNYLIICALALLTHSTLIYNWVINRNLLNLIFMVAAITFSILALIPMIKEYYAKLRIYNNAELLKLEVERLSGEVEELKESKQNIQVKLSQEIEETNRLKSDIEKMEQDDVEVISSTDDLNDQLLLVEDTSKSLDSAVNTLIDSRQEIVEFVNALSESLKDKLNSEEGEDLEDVKFHELFDTFMNEFKDMKDLIFQLKTLSFRIDVQASLSSDGELTQSSHELEGLSRNLAKFFNSTIGLLSTLEQQVRDGQDKLTEKLSQCQEVLEHDLEGKQELSSQLLDLKEQLDGVNEISCDKLDLIREILVDSVVVAENDLDETESDSGVEESVITDTNTAIVNIQNNHDALAESASLIQ